MTPYPSELPLELVDRIFEYTTDCLSGKPDAPTLLACMLTCKTYLPFAQSHLYRYVNIASTVDGFEDQLPSHSIDVGDMVRILKNAPHIAGYVRKCGLFLHHSSHDWFGAYGHGAFQMSGPTSPRLPWSITEIDESLWYRQDQFIKVFKALTPGQRLTHLSIHATDPRSSIHAIQQVSSSFWFSLNTLSQQSRITTLTLERILAFPIGIFAHLQDLTLTHSSVDAVVWPSFNRGTHVTISPKRIKLKTRGMHTLHPILDDASGEGSTVTADLSELEHLSLNFIGFEPHIQQPFDNAVPPLKEQVRRYTRICSIISKKAVVLKDLELFFLHEQRFTPALHFMEHHLPSILDTKSKERALQNMTLTLNGVHGPVGFRIFPSIITAFIAAAHQAPSHCTSLNNLHLRLVISPQDEVLTGDSNDMLNDWISHDVEEICSSLCDVSVFQCLQKLAIEVVVAKRGLDDVEPAVGALDTMMYRLKSLECCFTRHLEKSRISFALRVIVQ